jgi:hypothetical protein
VIWSYEEDSVKVFIIALKLRINLGSLRHYDSKAVLITDLFRIFREFTESLFWFV